MTVEFVLNKHMKGRGEGEDISNRSSKAVSAKNMQDTCVETTRSSLCPESKETVAISNAGQVTR